LRDLLTSTQGTCSDVFFREGETLVDLRATLKGIWLFATLEDADIAEIAALARPRRCPPRQPVVSQGDLTAELFAVVSGKLKATATNAAGDQVVFSIIGPGEVFGEIALLDGEARSATVTAVEDSELLAIKREAFQELVLRVPTLALSLTRVMARRLRDLSSRTQDVSLLPVEQRLAKVIIALAGRFSKPDARGHMLLAPKLSQQELANMVGASRVLVNRRLGAWADAGIVRLASGDLVIEDMEALVGLAREA
jgi:CRP/FNR family transcriptional regulator, cyclic AMP receptor protein